MANVFCAVVGVLIGLLLPLLYRQFRGGTLHGRLKEFFGIDPMRLEVVSRGYSKLDLPNLQQSIEALAAEEGVNLETIGYAGGMTYQDDLRSLLSPQIYMRVKACAAQFRSVDVGPGETRPCLEHGIFLLRSQPRAAIHLRSNEMLQSLELEVLGAAGVGEKVLDRVGALFVRGNVYRGKVLSLECSSSRRGESVSIQFHVPPQVTREEIILPERTLRLIERNTVGFSLHSKQLGAAGRSTKRGILLYGPPGTGKTYTAKWLAHSQPGLTVIVMSGDQLGLIRDGCRLARMLAPSLVIMEDVDLVATNRDQENSMASRVTLHQILNELDGMPNNTDVTFLLTTNRPEVIEPALAGRPGRIDQAIEYPLPDEDGRRRLFELYGRGLNLRLDDLAFLLARTEGASPAFIQELLRKAALIAGEKTNGEVSVGDAEVREALQELLFDGGDLTRRLLGFCSEPIVAR